MKSDLHNYNQLFTTVCLAKLPNYKAQLLIKQREIRKSLRRNLCNFSKNASVYIAWTTLNASNKKTCSPWSVYLLLRLHIFNRTMQIFHMHILTILMQISLLTLRFL
ncbi:hypothetical protein TcasGA2_TC034366 [Tribolium castaneum]|uniref:Uncharacterized protein n=1 Tax=Tribolium castaneum TaxID=7070 RepID=A0A139WBD1_TRICA|nr:hypothetical protein TcasGA2_TC034366 [Tribolium castaneum]